MCAPSSNILSRATAWLINLSFSSPPLRLPLEVINGGGDRAVLYLRFAVRAGIPNVVEL